MNEILLNMSTKEVKRLETITLVAKRNLKHKDAAQQLGLSMRQLKRLLKAYKAFGAAGLISKRRGKPSNRRHREAFREKIMSLVKERYPDFGPTLATEKLLEHHQVSINKETLRQWMMASGLWEDKRRKRCQVHQQRARRQCYGELVQIDGSPHDWFEGRAPTCCLLVFIDDATSQLMALRFIEVECTQGYFETTRQYIEAHGRPLAFYSDKHNIFRINIPEANSGTGESQFGRALRELGIELICANSPQAKGRVERANKTLQDRLIKELRLRKISSIEGANAFIPAFIKQYNNRFAAEPASPENLHRSTIPKKGVLDLIFTMQCERKLSKNLELSYNNVIYQVQTDTPSYNMRHASVKVCEATGANVTLIYKNKILDYKIFDKNNRPTTIASKKEIGKKTESQRKPWKPADDHPWRSYEKNQRRRYAA